MARSRLTDHPQFEAIVQALRAGGSPTTIARTYRVNADTLRSWWKRHRDDTPTPADEVRVSGTFSSPDAGAFTWDNVDSVPTDAQIRQVIALAGNDPDDFEWWVTSIDFSQNDTAWKRDRETAETMPGVKGTAYTGMAKRGKVSIKVERRKPDPAAEAALELADLARIGVAPVRWTRGYGRSGCRGGMVGLSGGAVVEAGLVASAVVEDLDVVEQDRA